MNIGPYKKCGNKATCGIKTREMNIWVLSQIAKRVNRRLMEGEPIMAAIYFKGRHFQEDMFLQSVRWYLASSLSYRDIEEFMQERGFSVDQSTINR